MLKQKSEHELRCTFCRRAPLLATYGINKSGKLFVRVKVWKQARIFGEIIAEGGPIKIRCRECFRWSRVNFEPTKITLVGESISATEN